MKKILLVVILLFFIIPVTYGSADTELKQVPVVEEIDLLVDGSITPITKSLTKTYNFISRVIIELDYDNANFVGSEFGAGAALTNGTSILINGDLVFPNNITTNDQFFTLAFDVVQFTDEATPKETHIYTRLALSTLLPPFGLVYAGASSLSFIVQDDLTDAGLAISKFQVVIAGSKFETVVLAESFTDDLFIIEFLNNLALYLVQYWFVIVAVSAIGIVVIKVLFF